MHMTKDRAKLYMKRGEARGSLKVSDLGGRILPLPLLSSIRTRCKAGLKTTISLLYQPIGVVLSYAERRILPQEV